MTENNKYKEDRKYCKPTNFCERFIFATFAIDIKR